LWKRGGFRSCSYEQIVYPKSQPTQAINAAAWR
jgi:hypothetical protein